jgi:hypothetical protein
MARDVLAGGSLDRGWVGLYAVGRVERTANGLWFVIDDGVLGHVGLVYSPTGEPKAVDEESPLWVAPRSSTRTVRGGSSPKSGIDHMTSTGAD